MRLRPPADSAVRDEPTNTHTEISDLCAMEYAWHCNRHTFTSRLVQAGVSLHTVAGLLGHESLEMTNVIPISCPSTM